MTSPYISVVMSVFNGAEHLIDTINSVLSQEGVDFEFIIVDDGSTDSSSEIISEFMQSDYRIKHLSQKNQGLTKSLVTACAMAEGKYIARQDNGDISISGRLLAQLEILQDNPNAVMTSTGVSFKAPDGEELYTVEQTPVQAREGLMARDISLLRGPPHHGSVMFDKEAYTNAGGYRPPFVVAQDLDLWTRLIELGEHIPTPGIFYHANLEKNAISVLQRDEQVASTKVIIECAKARETIGNDTNIIESFLEQNIARTEQKIPTPGLESNYYYFLGSVLRKSNLASSIKYLKKSVKLNPFNGKAVIRLLIGLIARRIKRG